MVLVAKDLSDCISAQERFLGDVQTEFETLYFPVSSEFAVISAKESHSHMFRQLDRQYGLQKIKSQRSCLCCLMRESECALSCGHCVCETCVVLFGTRAMPQRHAYQLRRCPICGQDNVGRVYNFVPPTAGLRVLSIDGGGVRGVIPATVLALLENRLAELGCSVHHFFDLVCGTSSGKYASTLFFWFEADGVLCRRPDRFGPICTRLECFRGPRTVSKIGARDFQASKQWIDAVRPRARASNVVPQGL